MNRRFCLPMFLLVVAGSPIGCNTTPPAGSAAAPEPNDEALPEFSLADVNANSSRYEEAVSPRDYLGQVSAWYFGHST